MSLGETQGISPSQKSSRDLSGVAPPLKEASLQSGLTSQCSGTSPSHSTPEGRGPLARPHEAVVDVYPLGQRCEDCGIVAIRASLDVGLELS